MHFFKQVPFRWNPPAFDSVVGEFFGASVDPIRSEIFPGPFDDAPSMRLTKNVYNLADVFTAKTNIIISEHAKRALEKMYAGRFLQIVFEHCFTFPYATDDKTYEQSPCFDSKCRDTDAIVRKFAKTYKSECPKVPYFELLAHRKRDIIPKGKPDRSDARPIELSDAENGLQTLDSSVSPSMVDEFGIVWDFGYWCRDDVFEVLDPFLRRPFFWCSRIELDGV